MKSLSALAAACLVVSSALPAAAFNRFEDYRISGAEIVSVDIAPPEEEAPARLLIRTNTEETIEIESDNGLDECRETLQAVIGNADRYVQIVVLTNADTMNGVLVVQCADLFR